MTSLKKKNKKHFFLKKNDSYEGKNLNVLFFKLGSSYMDIHFL